MLHVRMGKTRVRVVFGILKNLIVTILHKTSFIDKFVKESFPVEKEIFPFNLLPVQIVMLHQTPVDGQALTKETNVTGGKVMAIKKRTKRLCFVRSENHNAAADVQNTRSG